MTKPRRMSVVDRAGERYGRLTVLSRAENKVEPSGAVRAQWFCICDCGNGITTSGQSLSKGSTRSCGCLMKEKPIKHGMSHSGIYKVWSMMRQRCTNPNHESYKSYGARGIKMCEEWLDFEVFFAHVGIPPADGMTIDRIDNNKGYEPGNVRWATRLQQANNRRTNVSLSFGGRVQTVAEWGRTTGLGKQVILQRLKRGWSVDKALTTRNQR